jgi:hypothetical protein
MTPHLILPLKQLEAVQDVYSVYGLEMLEISTLYVCKHYLSIECIGSLHAVHAHQRKQLK